MNFKTLLSDSEKQLLVAAIKAAEEKTVGEIKVHIDNYCAGDVLIKAQSLFDKLKMYETKERTGVLIYIACKDKKMAILGDQGIHKIVRDQYWNNLVQQCIQYFKEEQYFLGLQHALQEVSVVLHEHFPSTSTSNHNEISNDISFGAHDE